VALSAYAASGIAKTDPWMTGWVACRMGLVSYIVPFAFVLDSALILGGKGSLLEILYALISVAIGVVVLCFGVEGYFRRPLSLPTRICWGFGGLGFMLPGLTFKVIGCALAFMGLLTMKLFPIRQLTEKNKLESLEK
jgi:TRAP-type uncharacterized transport system fused permease subunit